MPLPVIANTFRCTLNWEGTAGLFCHNVIHVLAAAADEEDVAVVIDTNLTTDMIAPLPTDCALESIDVIKLDGSSASHNHIATNTADGQGAGEAIPASAAILSLHTNQRGPSGRGRLFLGPTTEGNTNQGFYADGATRQSVIDAWTAFAAELEDAAMELVVASYEHAYVNGVRSFSMRPQVGTQRRRQNQLL